MIRAVLAFVVLMSMPPAMAQAQAVTPVRPYDLNRGRLVVWVVRHATAVEKQRVAAQKLAPYTTAPATYVEKTLSEFGQSSSDFGQTAGSYGQTSGSFGASAGDTGQTAGSAGKGPNDLGQTAGSYGQTAGSYGKTAAEFGRSISDINKPAKADAVTAQEAAARTLQEALIHATAEQWPKLQLSVVQVADIELKDTLAAVAGTQQYPDIVLGALPQPWWRESGLGLTMLGMTGAAASSESAVARLPGERLQEIVVLRRAPHPAQARAFLQWLYDDAVCLLCGQVAVPVVAQEGMQRPISLAQQAVASVLSGAPLGSLADPEAADDEPSLAQMAALRWDGVAKLGALQLQTEVSSAHGNRRFAVVGLRTMVISDEALGVVYSVVVLRRDAAGAWKVLQVSPGLSQLQQLAAVKSLASATDAAAMPVKTLGVSLAAPIDGDVRSPRPELWWDNLGGAVLQVVEWQAKTDEGYTGSKLLMLYDEGSAHLQTRVAAAFARDQVTYRWRVWSLARDGGAAFSPWRTFNVVGR